MRQSRSAPATAGGSGFSAPPSRPSTTSNRASPRRRFSGGSRNRIRSPSPPPRSKPESGSCDVRGNLEVAGPGRVADILVQSDLPTQDQIERQVVALNQRLAADPLNV